MTNNLTVLKKDLKSFAKRVKDFKYTESALITFLLTGLIELTGVSFNLFSAENEIQEQTKAINTSITNLKSDFRFARHENDKLLRKTNLELVKLMEQGDHVVKSPWSSWQYGINGFYNSWQGSYKGRGDKTADYKYERDKTMSKTKYEAYPHTLYGNTTELGLKQEPNASIPVSASLTPLIPRVKQANVSMAVDISELPSFTPRTVNPPTAPTISPVGEINAPSFSLLAKSLGNWDENSFDNASKGNGGVIEGGLIINNGTFITKRINNYSDGYGQYRYEYRNYDVKNAFNNYSSMVTDSSDPSVTTSSLTYLQGTSGLNRGNTVTAKKAGFIRMVSDRNYSSLDQGSTLVNKANFLYTRMPGLSGPFINELVHLDIHGAAKISNQISKLGTTTGAEYDAFMDLKDIALKTTNSIYSQTFINSGTVVIEGEKAAFINAYDHDRHNNNTDYAASIVNTKNSDITIHPYIDPNDGKTYNKQSAVFIVSAEVAGTGTPQIIYNAGNIKLYNDESAVYFLNPNGDVRWNRYGKDKLEAVATRDDSNPTEVAAHRSFTNQIPAPDGTMGKTFDYYDNDDDDQREITIVNRADKNNGKDIKIYGKGNVGVYLKTSRYISSANLDFKTKATGGDYAPITLYGDKNIGLYAPDDKISDHYISASVPTGTIKGNFAVNIGNSDGNFKKEYKSQYTANLSRNSDWETTAGTLGTTVLNDDDYTDNSYGIFSSINIDFATDTKTSKGIENGHQIDLYKNVRNSIGVLAGGDGDGDGNDVSIKLGKGKITLNGGFDNTGIIVGGTDTTSGAKSTDGKVTGDVVKITGDNRNDRGNRAIFAGNSANNEVTVNAVVSTDATNSITLVADKGAKITVNDSVTGTTPTIINTGASGAPTKAGVEITGSEFHHDTTRVNSDLTSKDNVGAAYASGGGIININRTSSTKPTSIANISIKGGTDQQSKKKVGFGLFADGSNSKINAQYNWIKVEDGSTNVASLNKAEIDLKGATVEYKGEGYALYTDSTSKISGAIDMTNAKLVLDGKAVGYVHYQDQPNMINVTGMGIDILDDDVIVSDLRKLSGRVSVDVENNGAPNRLVDQLLGSGVGTITSSNGKSHYKYAVVDNADININSAVDKADNSGTDTDSEVFTKRFLYQNSKIDVTAAGSVKAELDDMQMKAIDVNLKTPVGLAVTASAQTKDNDTTGN